MQTYEIINNSGHVVDGADTHTEALNVVTYYNRKQPENGPFSCRPTCAA